jgi:ABC-type transporter Mla maintaining outer membrane lipid asymmetry ATPase subunit MlaF
MNDYGEDLFDGLPAGQAGLTPVKRRRLASCIEIYESPAERIVYQHTFIGDNERRAGLYILGGSGTGKTELIKKLILEDIEHGHGVFFLDPHGDAVDELKSV